MRVAGIDCGTNSVRLLIADVPGKGAPLTDIVREMEIVRLGQGVDETGRLDEVALERTFAAIGEYEKKIRAHGVESLRFVATSATRDAVNRDVFVNGVRDILGITPQVLSGDEEARMSFTGAISVLDDAVGPILAVDLGGGSTELVLGDEDGTVISAYSMDVGSVRMRERRLHSNPPTVNELAAARADIQVALDEAERHVDLSATQTLVGLAGTITSITAVALGLEKYQPELIHGTFMEFGEIERVTQWFIDADFDQRAGLGFMHPGRVDVIGAGALVWQEVARRVAWRVQENGGELAGAVTSEHDILDGLALWAATEPQNWG
ncbi:MAG: Ppx/GppA family phosphatase [Actinomycetaceae bacterium]|nr:Ppx/GppA family phosphatase [Actinomycetaceae bacterium]